MKNSVVDLILGLCFSLLVAVASTATPPAGYVNADRVLNRHDVL